MIKIQDGFDGKTVCTFIFQFHIFILHINQRMAKKVGVAVLQKEAPGP